MRYYDNSFLVADPSEAWVLESSGRQWAARHLPHGAYAISNRPTIGREYDLASADLVAYAEERGWWSRGQRPFDFAEAYTDPHSGALASASCRLARSRQRLATRRATLTTSDMMALLRDHGPDPAGGPALTWPTGREAATVCMHGLGEGGSATAASMVARLTPGAPPTYWASMAPPCTGVFLPCWPDCGTPPESAVADEAPAASSPWWRYRRLWEAVAAEPEPAGLAERVRQAWLPLEAQLSNLVASPGSTAPLHVRRAVTAKAFAAATATLARLEQEVAPALTTG